MAYKALYRTYRPNTFDEVVGQQHIVQTLKNAVAQQKLAHAYLFCGPRGTGKTSIAKIFAKAVNCNGEKEHPCMECDSCLAITAGTHPDIVEIDAASNNGVEEVRSLIEKVKYAPIRGKYKIYIIDEVHMMSPGAFNALLKTIEEPPAHVIFILATTEPHKVLPTIISRCQRFDFTKIPNQEIEKRLRIGLDQEQIVCEDEVIRVVAQLSDGGMRDAWSIMDQCIAYARNDIQIHHVNEIYGILTLREKLDLLEMVMAHDVASCMNDVQQLSEKSLDVKRLTMDLIELLKESIIYEYTKDSNLLHRMNQQEAEQVIRQATREQRYRMIDTLMKTYDQYRNAADVFAYFEVSLLKMMDDSSFFADDSKETQTKPIAKTTAEVKTMPKEESKLKTKTRIDPESKPQPEIPLPDEDGEEIVSRETSEGKPNHAEPITTDRINDKHAQPLKDEFVLQLLVGANKPEKQHDLQQFQHINDYVFDLKWAKEANLLKS